MTSAAPLITHRQLQAGSLSMHIAEAGEGPLVVLLHGFPESWYSWRHQLTALAAAGYHAVAPDQRGYCQTEAPDEPDEYTMLHLTGDVIALMDALGEERAVVAGHDWGDTVAWHAALLRPDRVRGVIGLSIPFRPRGMVAPTTVMPQNEESQFYQLYFQKSGIAEAEYQRDVRDTLLRVLYSGSGDAPYAGADDRLKNMMAPRNGGYVARKPLPKSLPAWLTNVDLDFYTSEFTRTGFRGGLNWYRNLDKNWELLGAFAGAVVTVPALYVAGDRDVVLSFPGIGEIIPNLS